MMGARIATLATMLVLVRRLVALRLRDALIGAWGRDTRSDSERRPLMRRMPEVSPPVGAGQLSGVEPLPVLQTTNVLDDQKVRQGGEGTREVRQGDPPTEHEAQPRTRRPDRARSLARRSRPHPAPVTRGHSQGQCDGEGSLVGAAAGALDAEGGAVGAGPADGWAAPSESRSSMGDVLVQSPNVMI